MRLGIYPRLLLPFAASLLLAMLSAWWLATSLLGATLERRLDEQLQHAVDVLADGGIPYTPELLERMGRLLRADFLLVTHDGELGLTTLSEEPSQLRERVSAILARQSDGQHELRLGEEPYRLVVRSLPPDRDARYAAVAALSSLADARRAARGAGLWLGAATVLLLGALAWLGHRMASGITEPVTRLVTMAERIAGGERDVRVEVRQPPEIGALAGALNRMTERLQESERELVARNRLAALGELSARMAHEIRNPLTAIKLQIELLQEKLKGAADAEIMTLLDEIRRLELIVSTGLQLGRPQALDAVDTDLSQLTAEVAGLVGPQLAHRGIRLESRLGKLPSARLDRDRVKQVLLNLVANAANALTNGGEIRVTTGHATDRDEVWLTVEDSGPGLSGEQRAKLFMHATPSEGGGLGVGLKLSRELVELHGGGLEAGRSEALGGACFTVRFPLSKERRPG